MRKGTEIGWLWARGVDTRIVSPWSKVVVDMEDMGGQPDYLVMDVREASDGSFA